MSEWGNPPLTRNPEREAEEGKKEEESENKDE